MNSTPQKPRKIIQMILQITPVRLKVTGTPNGNAINKTNQATQQHYQNKHGDEINNNEPSDPPKGSNDADHGHDKDDDTEEDDGPLEDLNAGVFLLGGKPDSGADDGD